MGEKRDARDPARTKRLSLTRDHRPCYGENDKAARKAVPRFKAKSNRAFRHEKAGILRSLGPVPNEETLEKVNDRTGESAFRPFKKKCADEPLGKMIEYKRKMRKVRVGRKAESKARGKALLLESAMRMEDKG